MNSSLRGMVFSKYKSVSDFARALGWRRQKVGKIVNGDRVPTVKDVEEMASVLNLRDVHSFMTVFFPQVVHNVDN